jgi:hypothetical protein
MLVAEKGGHHYSLADALIDLEEGNFTLWKRVGQGYVEVIGYAIIVPTLPDKGYLDTNVTVGAVLGFTGGTMFTKDKTYRYAGGGIMPPQLSASVTTSTATPSPGLNFAYTYGFPWFGGYQVGYSWNDGPFGEVGVVKPGWSLTVFWVWEVK